MNDLISRYSDPDLLWAMDQTLGKMLACLHVQLSNHYSSGKYIDAGAELRRLSKIYSAMKEECFSNRCHTVWSEHYNRWPAERDVLPAIYRPEQQPHLMP